MSTTIYEGRLFHGSFKELLRQCNEFRPYIIEQGEAMLLRFKKNFTLRQENEGKFWYTEFLDQFNSPISDPFTDTRFELVAFPYARNKILLIPFCGRRDFLKQFHKVVKTEEFGYWNNTDWPDGMTEKEWNVRRKMWEKVLPGAGIPAECGFTICLHQVSGPLPPWGN